jgi:carboxyl-terminal processing protease
MIQLGRRLLILLRVIGFSFFLLATQAHASELSCGDIQPIIDHGFLLYHVTYNALTPNLEDRTITQYVKRLDPSKRYLLQNDVDQIHKLMKGVFGKMKNKDCAVLKEVQAVYKKRMVERSEFAKSVLNKKEFKFNPNTEIMLDPDKRSYPNSKKVADDFQEKFIQFQVSNYIATDMKLEESKQYVIRNYERTIKRIDDQKDDDLYANYLDAFARSLDPHSSFFNEDTREDFEIEMSLSLEGIGATLSSQDGFTVVEQLIPGGAAALSGLVEPGDKIIQVRKSKDEPMENVIEMDLRDVVSRIRGPKGTPVDLTLLRKTGDKQERKTISLVRDKINLEEEAAQIHYLDRDADGQKLKVGLLNLPSFYLDSRRGGRSSATDLKKLLKEARDNKVDSVVLDLSTNGGGSLEDAVRIAGLFFKTGNVVKQSSGRNERSADTLADTDPAVDWAGPLVVLTSRISASASEIVAGTMKDYKRAVIVGGDHTFGKGSVQQVMPLKKIGALKVTVGMFFTPSGYSTQHRGVTGDVVLPGPYSNDDIGEKSLDYSLPPKKISAFISKDAYVTTGPDAWKEVESPVIDDLKKKSEARVAKNADFQKIETELKKSKKKVKTVKLSDALKDQTEAQEQKKKGPKSRKEKIDDYLKRADIQEAVNVAADLALAEHVKDASKETKAARQ